MMNEQMDMTLFHELLWDESTDDQLVIALRKMLEIEETETLLETLRESLFGAWSGWSM